MGANLELFYFTTVDQRIEEDKPKVSYIVSSIKGGSGTVSYSLSEIAESIYWDLYFNCNPGYLYDNVTLYAAMSENSISEDTPRLVAGREGVHVRGPSGSIDNLLEIQSELIKLLKEKRCR